MVSAWILMDKLRRNFPYFLVILFGFCCFVVVTKSDETHSHSSNFFQIRPEGGKDHKAATSDNYLATGQLVDGETQNRMKFGNVIVRETFVTRDDVKEGRRKGLLLRQVGSGPHFLQLIYKLNYSPEGEINHRKLVECEVLHDWNAANEFRTQFRTELANSGLAQLKVPANKAKRHVSSDNDAQDFNDIDIDGANGDTNDDPLDYEVGSEPIDLDPDHNQEHLVNVTVRVLRDDEIKASPELSKAFNLKGQRRACNRLHKKMRQVVDAKNMAKNSTHRIRFRREAFRVGIMPGTLWCGDGSLADQPTSIGAHVGADRCCRQHDGCPFLIDAMSSKYGMFNYRMHTISHCTCDESLHRVALRKKRESTPITSAFLQGQLPGTEWCGRGFSAKEETTLGAYTGADNCCRRHDLGCPFFIEAFQEKYGLFNWRLYTINHCTCDERFRSCLKQTNTGAANFVGKIFFNVVQTKCFLLKPERTCAKTSWFGKCLKHEYKKQAHLRDPIPY